MLQLHLREAVARVEGCLAEDGDDDDTVRGGVSDMVRMVTE